MNSRKKITFRLRQHIVHNKKNRVILCTIHKSQTMKCECDRSEPILKSSHR